MREHKKDDNLYLLLISSLSLEKENKRNKKKKKKVAQDRAPFDGIIPLLGTD